jgi:hypothetical protein
VYVLPSPHHSTSISHLVFAWQHLVSNLTCTLPLLHVPKTLHHFHHLQEHCRLRPRVLS